jgi:hypothetical protein
MAAKKPNMRGYCVKCRTMREIKEATPSEIEFIKPKSKAKKGTCSKCGSSIYKFSPKEK